MQAQKKSIGLWRCGLLAALVATTFLAVAQEKIPAGFEKIRSLEGITEYSLENGMKLLLFPDPSKETITVNITYLVGSKHENYGETGMAHLLEHLVFKGTPRHPNIPDELTKHGAQPNGTTWVDRTNYYETFAATDENLEWALDLEADRMINSFIAKKDLDSEMTVVRNEFEMGENNPTSILIERMMSSAYIWHNYGKTTIGARSDIENVPIERLQAFYKKYYQPDNAILIVAGRIDTDKTLALVDRFFSPIPKPDRVLPQNYTWEPTQDGERTVTLRRTGDIQLAAVTYHLPSGSHPDFAPLDVLTEILGNTPSGRLHKALVETEKASNAYAFNFQFRDPSLALYTTQVPKDDNLDDAKNTLIDTVENLNKNPITADELNRAKAKLLKDIEQNLNSSQRISLQLSEWIGMGDWRLLFLHRDRIQTVTVEDVQRVANLYLIPSNRTLGLFIPTKMPRRAEIPAQPDIQEMLADFKGREAVAMGEAFDPSPENIESRLTRTKVGELQLALLPKKTRGESVEASIKLAFGDARNLNGKGMIGRITASMLTRGTAKHDRESLQKEFDRLKATVSVTGEADNSTVRIQTIRPNLAETLGLVAEVLREANFPEKEMALLKQEMIAQLEQNRSQPFNVVIRENRLYHNRFPEGHPNHRLTLEEEIAAIQATQLDEVKSFHGDFYGASHAYAAVVGDFDADEISSLFGKLLAGWKSKQNYERLGDPYKPFEAVNRSFETPDKANAVFLATQVLDFVDTNPDYPALQMANFLIGGGFLNSRLAVRLRQKEGLSYSAGSFMSVDAQDSATSFMAYAICAPENMAKLEDAFNEEIQRVIEQGFTDDELTAAIDGYLQSRRVMRSQDRTLAGTLRQYLEIDRTMAWDAALEKNIAKLKTGQLNNAVKNYLSLERISIMKAGDFPKTPSKSAE